MIRSIFSGVSGMRNHQTKMDVLGNNIANVNTAGFKYGRVQFSDQVSQLQLAATSPGGAGNSRGGVNPKQVGLGSLVATIDTVHTQGNLQTTNKVTDLSIQGEGFFVLSDGPQRYYTRNGAFDFDREGSLVNPGNGLHVMGYQAIRKLDAAGEPFYEVDNSAPIKEVAIPAGAVIPPRRTTSITFKGNLDERVPVSPATDNFVDSSVEVFDSLGNQHFVTVRYTHTGANTWDWTILNNDPTYVDLAGAPRPPLKSPASPPNPPDSNLVFGSNGLLVDRPPPSGVVGAKYDAGSVQLGWMLPSGVITSTTIIPDFGNETLAQGVTQFATESTVVAADQNGYTRGELTGVTVDKVGLINGVFSNGRQQLLGQVAIATFTNPGGLMKEGENSFIKTNNSGDAIIRAPGQAEAGSITAGSLEMSNVDLAEQFAEMIITQRGFQANSRVITTSDEILQELINLKR